MQLTLLPNQILHFLVIGFCLFTLALIWKKERVRSASWMLVIALLGGIFNLLEELNITREIHLVTPVLLFAQGPAFYLFVYNLLLNHKTSRKQLLHFIPCLVALPFTDWTQIIIALASVSQIIYTIALILIVLRYRKASEASQSDLSYFNVSWISVAFVSILLMGAVDLVRLNSQPYISTELNLSGQFLTTLMGLLIYCYLIIQLLNQKQWLPNVHEIELALENSNDNAALEHQLFQQIHAEIMESGLFKLPRLSLRDVATHLGLNVRDVSRAINLGSEYNFNEYINRLRIAEVKTQMDLQRNRALLDIALESGFNSKSNFNQVFKQIEKMTPGQYQSEILA